ncbi:hypothetical protein DFJ74DRAFT_708448 [Hyaloraphidium curvatum]|nr:hypothetical protein DFJ74DRAFT_708448 [Hyaloraphidium curvatum]
MDAPSPASDVSPPPDASLPTAQPVTMESLLSFLPASLLPPALFLLSGFSAWVPSLLSLLDHVTHMGPARQFGYFFAAWISLRMFHLASPSGFARARIWLQAALVALVIAGLAGGFAAKGVEWYHAPPAPRRNATLFNATFANATGNGTAGEEEGFEEL